MSIFGAVKLIDTTGAAQGVLIENNCPTTRDYLIGVAEGDVAQHTRWGKLGYTPTATVAQSDIQSQGGLYVFPTAATAMAVIGAAADDGSPAIYSGTDTGGGTATKLVDTGKNFTTVPAVAGDTVILEKAGASPEFGIVTSLTGTDTLNVAAGFSQGGSALGRTYDVVQQGLSAGAHAVEIHYLDTAYLEKREIVILNGAAEVGLTARPFRINGMEVIAAGSGSAAAGAISLKAPTPATAVYANITLGYTIARQAIFTVPAANTLFINKFTGGFSLAAGIKWEYGRITLRANEIQDHEFLAGNIFYPYAEIIANNSTIVVPFLLPLKFIAKTDLRVSIAASDPGVAVCSLRGWLET